MGWHKKTQPTVKNYIKKTLQPHGTPFNTQSMRKFKRVTGK